MNTAETSQVSFIALEESQILVWNRDKLKLSISSDRYLQTILDHILGKDIVKKLMLSLDIDSAMGVPISEKTKLMKTNYNLDHQILSLNTLKNSSQCFWNLSSTNAIDHLTNDNSASNFHLNHNPHLHPQESTL
ncbi:hypothetical protein SSS_10533 [Sarcoptes scabiei]|nr:hypothetical protein SSS_10533 [Sarcoptes scabiei]